MSNQVYSNVSNLYANQEYEFNTDIVGTTGPLNITIRIIKDVNSKTIRMVFPTVASFTKSVADGLLTNSTPLPENFRPSVDAFTNIYVKDIGASKNFLLGMLKIDTVGVFSLGLGPEWDLFINAVQYGIHYCICEFPY
jgi:hypothetical protein